MRNIRQNLFFAFVYYNALGVPIATARCTRSSELFLDPTHQCRDGIVIGNALRLRRARL